jgi:hypothetical protein
LQSEELHDLYSSTNVIRVMKSRRDLHTWGNERFVYNILVVKRDNLGDLGVDGEIVLKWILKKCLRLGTELNWLRISVSWKTR